MDAKESAAETFGAKDLEFNFFALSLHRSTSKALLRYCAGNDYGGDRFWQQVEFDGKHAEHCVGARTSATLKLQMAIIAMHSLPNFQGKLA